MYIWKVLISVDQFINTLLGPAFNFVFKSDRFGDPDETISSALGKTKAKRRCRLCRFICKILDFIDPRPGDHCADSIEKDEDASDSSY